MKRIAIDCRLIGGAGIGRYIEGLLSEFGKMNLPFEIILLGRPDKLRRFPFPVVRFTSPIYSIREQLFFPYGKLKGIALLHSPHYNFPLFWRGKLVVTIHDIAHIARETREIFGLARVYAHFMLKRVTEKAQRLITVSNFSKCEIVNYLGADSENVIVIPNGVNRDIFHPRAEEDVRRVKKRLGIKGEYILYVGNIKPHKNLVGVIDAFKLLRRKELMLVIVGALEGLRSRMKNLDERLSEFRGRILYTGVVDDSILSCLYTGAELLVLPSLYEGFGLPPLEALACGTPSVVSDRPFFRETLGDAACFVEPESTESIRWGIDFLLDNEAERKKIVEKGIELFKLYEWREIAKRTVGIYLGVIEG